MTHTTFENRRAVLIENDAIRVAATSKAAISARFTTRPRASIPFGFRRGLRLSRRRTIPPATPNTAKGTRRHLLAGILGHNICLDTFGGPSAEEAAAGMPVHGEGPVIAYEALSRWR